jgi:hypothetical protein
MQKRWEQREVRPIEIALLGLMLAGVIYLVGEWVLLSPPAAVVGASGVDSPYVRFN